VSKCSTAANVSVGLAVSSRTTSSSQVLIAESNLNEIRSTHQIVSERFGWRRSSGKFDTLSGINRDLQLVHAEPSRFLLPRIALVPAPIFNETVCPGRTLTGLTGRWNPE
jgi:hypothetical protein